MRFWIWGAPAAAFLYWQNNGIQTSRWETAVHGLPTAFNGFRIVHLSDLHGKVFGADNKRLIDAVRQACPDLIVVTGDLIDKRRSDQTDVAQTARLVRAISAVAPVYFVTGNHEWQSGLRDLLVEQVTKAGGILLDNRARILRRGNAQILVAGLADECSLVQRPTGWKKGLPGRTIDVARLERLAKMKHRLLRLRAGRRELCTLVLVHRPDLFGLWVGAGASVVFSGHAHGGQVRLPVFKGLLAPDQGILPRFSEGIYCKMQARMVVSRGLGNSSFPQRLFNRPELVIVTLRSK